MRLIVFTAPESIPNESLLLNQCFRQGLQSLHVRKPAWGLEHVKQYVLRIDSEHRRHVVLHSHHHLAEELELGVRILRGSITEHDAVTISALDITRMPLQIDSKCS